MLFQRRAYSVPFWLNVDTHRLQFPELIEHFDDKNNKVYNNTKTVFRMIFEKNLLWVENNFNGIWVELKFSRDREFSLAQDWGILPKYEVI